MSQWPARGLTELYHRACRTICLDLILYTILLRCVVEHNTGMGSASHAQGHAGGGAHDYCICSLLAMPRRKQRRPSATLPAQLDITWTTASCTTTCTSGCAVRGTSCGRRECCWGLKPYATRVRQCLTTPSDCQHSMSAWPESDRILVLCDE